MRLLLALPLLLLALGGCASQVPIAVNPPISSQYKAKSVHQWDVLADDMAHETVRLLEKDPEALSDKPLYVRPPQEDTPFARAFRNLLITRMVNRGLAVSSQPADAVEVQYETQLVRHQSSRYAHVPGTVTALGAGVWVVRELIEGSFAAVPGALGLAALADWGIGKWGGFPSKSELIVTASIAIDSHYVFRKSNVYYIEAEDSALFVEGKGASTPLKRLEVVGR